MLIKRLPSDNERKQFRDKLNRIVKKYEKDIDLNLIGFPKNYRELIKKQ
jgi:abortive infection bacteriophage resistance protein